MESSHWLYRGQLQTKRPTQPEHLGKSYFLRLDDRFLLGLSDETKPGLGDSSGLQKGLVMFEGVESLCGEGVGFGAPAVQYSNRILFSTAANIRAVDNELVKSFSIDALQRITWKNRFPIDNRVYNAIQPRLADAYRTEVKARRWLTRLMRIQTLLGVRLSPQRIRSRGNVEMRYSLSGNRVTIRTDCSKLVNKDHTRILIFNEQSADFHFYKDDFGALCDESIGVWEEVRCERASFTNQKVKVTFSVEKIPGTQLYRGRELLEPRLDWAGLCYSIPKHMEHFSYSVEIS